MANYSSETMTPAEYIYVLVGSLDNMISIPVNCWALWLIVSGKKSLIHTEILTLNLFATELAFSLGFFFTLVYLLCDCFAGQAKSAGQAMFGCYTIMAVEGRLLFQFNVCVDRYLAVVWPMVFIRYKHIKYRGALLAAAWLVVLCSGLCSTLFIKNPISFTVVLVCLMSVVLSMELFFSLSVLRILWRPGPGRGGAQERTEGNKQKRRAAKVMLFVLAALLINMVPILVVSTFIMDEDNDLLSVAFTMSTLGSSTQAFLFLSRSGKLCKPC